MISFRPLSEIVRPSQSGRRAALQNGGGFGALRECPRAVTGCMYSHTTIGLGDFRKASGWCHDWPACCARSTRDAALDLLAAGV